MFAGQETINNKGQITNQENFNKAFNKDDFPTLGFPTITTLIPSLIIFPLLPSWIKILIFLIMFGIMKQGGKCYEKKIIKKLKTLMEIN